MTTPASVDGQTATVSSLVQKVTASIGGVDCFVQYAGGAPGLIAGAVQVNLLVPAGVSSGEQAIVVSVGGVSSQSGVTVLVQ